MSLYLLAFLGGVLTLLSPCILPVLPFVFARTGKPFVQGSLPLLVGMALAFAAVASLGAVAGAWAVRLNQAGRFVALAALALFALALLWPRLADVLGRPLVRLGDRLSQRVQREHGRGGWGASVLLGIATGLVWSPCAGPILGLILSGAALAGPSVHSALLLLAYAAGAALALAVALRVTTGPGNSARAAWRARLQGGAGTRRLLGAAMLAGVVAVGTGLDTGLLARLSLGAGTGIEQRLLQSALGRAQPPAANRLQRVSATGDAVAVPSRLPIEPITPRFDGGGNWFNSAPLTAEALRGKVVLVNFWTYSCINCLRTLPHVRAWARHYADQGLVVVGVHTPEFAFEKDAANVQRALRDLKIDYPVVQDNQYGIWRAFHNQYWPALYVVDAQGRVRHHQFGEGGQARTEAAIQALLREAGRAPAAHQATTADTRGVGLPPDNGNVRSPETYLGYAQASGFASPGGMQRDRPAAYTVGGALGLNRWGLAGSWTVGAEYAQAEQPGAGVALRFHARDAHLVLGTPPGHGPVRFQLTLDGRPPGADHGEDVDAEGRGTIDAQRLYQLVRQKGTVDDRTLEIRFLDAGARAFAFTFG